MKTGLRVLIIIVAIAMAAPLVILGGKSVSGGVAAPITKLVGMRVQNLCGADGRSTCVVGTAGPGKGTIFFVDYNNIYPTFDYLEAAPVGWAGGSNKDDPAVSWCLDIKNIIEPKLDPWSSRRVGQGKANTDIMQAACNAGAASQVKLYNESGRSKFTDWFLPSLGELMLMTENMQGVGDLLPSDYWSSSEFSDIGAWVQSVGHGYQGTASKATTFKVRPIRSF